MTSQFIDATPEATIVEGMIEDMQTQLPTWEADEADPGVYWCELTAERQAAQVTQFNASVRQSSILWATGEALDNKLREVDLEPLTNETDDEKRARYKQAFSALDKDSDDYVLRLARQSAPTIGSIATVSRPLENQILLYLATAAGMDPGEAIRNQIESYMSDSSRRPIWLDYSVRESSTITFMVDAAVTYLRGTQNPKVDVERQLMTRLVELRKLNTGIYVYDLEQAMKTENVVNVVVSTPANTLAKGADRVYVGTIGTITYTEES